MPVPWHLWGTSQVLECPYTGLFATTTVSGQLNRINYGRPDTWTFFFSARIQSTTLAVKPPTITQILTVDFDIILGVGRSMVQLPSFESYRFAAVPNSYLDGQQIWSGSVNGPIRDQNHNTAQNVVSRVPAQDIQVNARASFYSSETHGDSATVAIYSAFVPMTHIRPEWHEGSFPGNENMPTG